MISCQTKKSCFATNARLAKAPLAAQYVKSYSAIMIVKNATIASNISAISIFSDSSNMTAYTGAGNVWRKADQHNLVNCF